MSAGPSAADGAYRPRLQRRLMLAMAGYTLLVGAMLGALAMVFVYAVEDSFFEAALNEEAARQQAHHVAHGAWAAPAWAFMRLYPRGAGLPPDLAREIAGQPLRREAAGDDGRHYHLRPVHADGSLLVAEVSQQLVVRPLRQTLLAWLAVAGGGLVLVALLLGWALARRISAPLALLAGRVAAGTPDALPQGLARGMVRDEIGELARHLEALHDRTRDFIARERAFTADASHELRTPLAVLAIACERLRAEALPAPRPDPAGQSHQAHQPHPAVLASMQAAIWQLQQTVALLLALSREAPGAEAGAGGPTGPHAAPAEAPLLPVLEQLLLAHVPLLEQLGVQVDLQVPAGLTRPWPPALTQVLLGNLLANAISHAQRPAADGQAQALRVQIRADAACLWVCNPSVPPPAPVLGPSAGRVPGIKGQASSGQGLGLSIVRRLAERHGLQLSLHHADGHTCVSLR